MSSAFSLDLRLGIEGVGANGGNWGESNEVHGQASSSSDL